MEQMPFGPTTKDEFVTNPEPRVACALVLDVSSSMAGEPISQLNDGLLAYKDELSADPLAKKRVEVTVITFGSDVRTVCDFCTAETFFPPTLVANGLTYMGQGMNQAIDALEARKQQYKDNGISYYRPWLFLISDGAPNDPDWEAAAARAVQAEKENKFKTFCVGVAGADMEILRRFSVAEPLSLKGLEFRKLFLWLSRSQKSVSRSTPGDKVILEDPTKGPGGWGEI